MNHVDPIKYAYEDCELLKKYIVGTLKTHNEKNASPGNDFEKEKGGQ